jgi:putative acetyltransferase
MPETGSAQKGVLIRAAVHSDAAAIARVHYDAVHVTASADYDEAILREWSYGISEDAIKKIEERIADNPEHSNMLVAELAGEVIGFGDVVPGAGNLRSLYVSPSAGRRGAGAALLKELEAIACKHGVSEMWLNSSLTAEPFYRAHGYVASEQFKYPLPGGQKMDCIKMSKQLAQ